MFDHIGLAVRDRNETRVSRGGAGWPHHGAFVFDLRENDPAAIHHAGEV